MDVGGFGGGGAGLASDSVITFPPHAVRSTRAKRMGEIFNIKPFDRIFRIFQD